MYFCMYYFHDFFTHKIADFHYEAYQDLKFKKYKYLIWEWFREGGKTTIIKMFITWCICFAKKNYIIFICYKKETAKRRLYDIALWLQTNKLIINDFGQLFYEGASEDKFSKKKAVSEFITTNKIKVEASSTQEPLRGRVYDRHRPDLLIFDDFENEQTKASFPITQRIIANMDEAMTGLGGGGNIVYLCNYISDMGSVEVLHEAAKNDPLMKLHRVDLVTGMKGDELGTGVISWPQKYVFTDTEALEKNEGVEIAERRVISIEERRRTYNAKPNGRKLFEQEMLNQPIVRGDKVFDPGVIRKMLQEDARVPDKYLGNWMFWDEYKPYHRYAIGADVAEGVGGDFSAAVLIDFSGHPRAKIVGTYSNQHIAPDVFAYELEKCGNVFGGCLIAPELNNHGYATVGRLREIYMNIYEKEVGADKVDLDREPTKVGWVTNAKTKPEILYDLKRDIEEI